MPFEEIHSEDIETLREYQEALLTHAFACMQSLCNKSDHRKSRRSLLWCM